MSKNRYSIITPAHNEAHNLPHVIDSIMKQDVLPKEWIIIDDRSADNTWHTIKKAADICSFIKPAKINGPLHRQVGENVVHVFYKGLRKLNEDVDYIVKLDADIVLYPDYFAKILQYFAENSELGMASGKTYFKKNGNWILERCPDTHVVGPCKTYRYECFKDINGLIPILGWDILDGAEARRRGWETHSYRNLPLFHLRQMGYAKGMLKGRLRTGRAMHSINAHPVFVLAKSLYRSIEIPYLSGLLIPVGFLLSLLKKAPQVDNEPLIKFLRREQILRVLGHKINQEELLSRKIKKDLNQILFGRFSANDDTTKKTVFDPHSHWHNWAVQKRRPESDSKNMRWTLGLGNDEIPRLLLADPPLVIDRLEANNPNLGILYLLSYARKHAVNGVYHYLPVMDDLNSFFVELEKFRPHMVGISFTTMGAANAYATIKAIKARYPSITVVCGGAHPTIMPEEVLNESLSDICVLGEGEITLTALIQHCQDNLKLREISGLAWKQGDVVNFSPARQIISNLDKIPHPAWEHISPNQFLGPPIRRKDPSTVILTSRGCPYGCVFCSNPVWKLHKPYYRARSPENIAEEILLLYQKGYREIYIRSDEFNTSVKWAESVCEAINSLKLKDMVFQCNLRADRMTDKLADKLAEMGCWLVHVGIESANDNVLKGIRKYITVSQVESLCKTLKKRKIRVFGFFMMGQVWEENSSLVYETKAEVRNTLRFVWHMSKKGLIDYMSWQVATPIPGADLYEIANKYGLIDQNIKPKNMWEPTMELKTISNKEMKRLRLEGMLLQSYLYARSGKIQWRHWRKLVDKVSYICHSFQ